MEFVHLHVHSHYSKGWGIPTVEEVVQSGREMGLGAIALTDTNGLYGLFPFLEAAREAGIHPILGSELVKGDKRVLAIIKDREGYQNLSWLISAIHCDPGFELLDGLKQKGRGLFFISDQPKILLPLMELYGGSVYFEVSWGHYPYRAYTTARSLGIPPVATSRAYMLSPLDYGLHRVIRAIYSNKRPDRLSDREAAGLKDYLAHPSEICGALSFCQEAIGNTWLIRDGCSAWWGFDTVLPRVEGLSDEGAFERLFRETLEGAIKRYKGLPLKTLLRIYHEMGIIRQKGYAHYFLLVRDIARRSCRTCGRGSAAASIVAYALGLTHVDPIAHGLMFERFLNPKRPDPPDIDLDFAWDERDGILEYVFERYGRDRVAMVSNQNTFGTRAAIRSVARVLGMTEEEIGEVIKRIEVLGLEGLDASGLHPRWKEVISMAKRLRYHFYHLSTHCGGIVLVPDQIRRHCPVEVSPKGYQVLQWEKEGVESSGLVKIDLLGNRTLGVVRDAIKMLISNYHVEGDLDGYYQSLNPIQDHETLRIFYHGNTMGVFYFESPATRRVLTQVGHGMSFEEYLRRDPFHLNVIVTSIIRPASNRSISTWIERLHGQSWDYPHPLLEPVLQETLGVMVFQEQLSQAAMYLAGFDAGEADELRRVVSKKHKEKRLKDFYGRFLMGARDRGVEEVVIKQVWDMMMGFDGYSFCKPHSASYTMLAYKSAFLKAHYPAEFMAAVISNRGGYYTTFAYISETKRMGIRILGPDINESHVSYTGINDTIRMGFMEIKGLKDEFMYEIVDERTKNGPYKSLNDFLVRLKNSVTLDQVRLLIKAGCFDSIANEISIPEMIWISLSFFKYKTKKHNFVQSFSPYPKIAVDETVIQRAKREMEAFGFPISAHPISVSRIRIRHSITKAKDLKYHIGEEVYMLGWWISHKPIYTVKREEMEFITFEDETGLFEVVVFPDVYKRYSQTLFFRPCPFLLRGVVEEEKGAISMELRHIHPIRGDLLY